MNVNLVLVKKNGQTRGFPLTGSVTVIGRSQQCDLCVPLMVASRRHCQLNQDEGELTIRDLGSRNGTFVNGQQVEQANLKSGDKITIGSLMFIVQIDGTPAADSEQIQGAAPGTKPASATKHAKGSSGFDELDDLDDLDNLDDLINLDSLDSQTDTAMDDLDNLDDIINED